MKRTAWAMLAMSILFLLGTIIAVGSLVSMGGRLDTARLIAAPLSVPTVLVSCLDPLAILLEIVAIVLIVMDSKQVGNPHHRLAWTAAIFFAIWGVLNATTNLILSRMEEGDSFDEALRHTQEIGIAETDPSGDIEGWDAAVKLSAMITVLMDHPFTPDLVNRTGIGSITPKMIAEAKAAGKRYKLVAHAWKEGEQVKAKVSPELVGTDSVLYNISGSTSIVQFESDVLGKLSLIEKDVGTRTTAYGLLADFINAVTG